MQHFKDLEYFLEIIKNSIKNPTKIDFISHGMTNYVFDVQTEKDNYIFRFPREKMWNKHFENEYLISSFILKNSNLQISNIILKKLNNNFYSIHKKIIGTPCVEKFKYSTKKEKIFILNELVNIISIIQNLKPQKNFAKVSQLFDELPVTKMENYDIKRHDILKFAEEQDPVFCHGDFHMNNMIYTTDKNIALLDLTFGGISSQYLDLSRVLREISPYYQRTLIDLFEDKFKLNVDKLLINELISFWNYIMHFFIIFLKKSNH